MSTHCRVRTSGGSRASSVGRMTWPARGHGETRLRRRFWDVRLLVGRCVVLHGDGDRSQPSQVSSGPFVASATSTGVDLVKGRCETQVPGCGRGRIETTGNSRHVNQDRVWRAHVAVGIAAFASRSGKIARGQDLPEERSSGCCGRRNGNVVCWRFGGWLRLRLDGQSLGIAAASDSMQLRTSARASGRTGACRSRRDDRAWRPRNHLVLVYVELVQQRLEVVGNLSLSRQTVRGGALSVSRVGGRGWLSGSDGGSGG